MKRILLILLALMLALPFCASAEDAVWACPNCGQTGNTGNFCPNCAAARPSVDWICPSCGQAGNTGNFCSNCATPRPSAESAAEVQPIAVQPAAIVNEHLEQIPGETDRVMVCVDDVDASSFIANKKNPSLWQPANAVDGDESTCWQFSAKKGLKGKSWLRLSFAAPEAVDEIWFKNGFWAVNEKGGDQYVINARLKEVKVEFCYAGDTVFRDAVALTLKDESRTGWQQFSLGRHEGVTQLRIAVISVYKGSAYPNDVCLSEVMAVQHGPAAGANPPRVEKAATVYESRPDITGCSLTQKLATRSGPGTEYAEPGTFFGSNWQSQTVKVLKKSFDGSVWWVQVDFRNGSKNSYRVWTGAKRVDVDLSRLKEETPICACDIYPTSDTWFGPGGNYAKAKISINRSACGEIFQRVNGYVDVKYWFEDDGFDGDHRVWLPESAVYNLYYGDNSGES